MQILAVAAATLAVVGYCLVAVQGRWRFDAGTWLVVLPALLAIAPLTAARLFGTTTTTIDVATNQEVNDLGWAESLYRFADVGVFALSGVIILRALTSRRYKISWSKPGVALAGVVLAGSISSAVGGAGIPAPPIVLGFLLLAASLARTTWAALITGVHILFVLFAALSGVMAIIRPAESWYPCPDEKCLISEEVFTGITTHGNSLGLFVAFCLPILWISWSGRNRLLWVSPAVVLLLLSGSRTALLAVVSCFVMIIVAGIRSENGAATIRRPGILRLGIIVVALVGLVLPAVVGPQFATGRGLLWHLAIEQIARMPFIGWGHTAWADLYEQGAFGSAAAYSTHNQLLEVAIISGLVGLALFFVVIITCVVGGSRSSMASAGLLLFAVLVVGISERPISLSLLDQLTWVIVLLVLFRTSVHTAKKRPQRVEQAVDTQLSTGQPGTRELR